MKAKHTKDLSQEEKMDMIFSYQGEIIKYLNVFCKDKSLIEDIVQETIIEAWRNMGKVKNWESLKFWMLTIAKNKAKKIYGKKYMEQRWSVSLEDIATRKEMEIGAISDSELYEQMENLEGSQIKKLIEGLSEKEKAVLKLYYIYEHSLKEIAIILDENYNNIRTIAYRAKKKLKEELERERNAANGAQETHR